MPGLGIDFDNRVLIHVIPEGVQTLVSSSSRKPLAKINMMWSRVPNYWCRPRGSSGGSRALWNQGDGWKIFFVLITVTSHSAGSLPNTIKIGGLFDMSDSVEEISFRYAVDRVNGDRDILPNSRLTAQIDRIQPEDSFYASKQVCRDLQMGIAGVFGPQSGVTASHVQSICDALEVPHIETRWDYRLVREDYSVNLHPYPQALGQAYADMVTAMNWKSCLILYEESEGLVRLQEVLKLSPKRLDIKIQIRQLDPGPGGDHRPLLKDIKQLGENRIILDCKNDHVQEILKQAQQVGIMTAYHTFFITTLDLHLVELEELKYGGTNITAFRLVDPDLEEVQNMIEDIKFEGGRGGRKTSDLNRSTIRTETALIFDAVHLFSRALTDLDRSQELSQVSLNCDGPGTWQYGNSLINYMKMVEMNGLTGKIQFDSRGFRSDFDLDIVELKKEGLSRVGRWNRGAGANFTRNFTESYSEIIESLHNKTLVVTTILAEPYTMYKENSAVLSGNEQFEGYSVDLVDAISKILGFNYSFRLVEDGKHGSYNKDTGTWNGMVGELLSQKADLAVGDLTITYEREQGVDFTMPFMNLGVTILFTKPTAKDPNLFSFLSPLSLGVWIYMATAYLAVSLLLYLLASYSVSVRMGEPLSATAILNLLCGHGIILVTSVLANRFVLEFLSKKRNTPSKKILDDHLTHQTRMGLWANIPRVVLMLRIALGPWAPFLQSPIVFFVFYIFECFFAISVITSIDVNILMRYLLIFHEPLLIKWKPEVWWMESSKLLVYIFTIFCVLGIGGDILQDIVCFRDTYNGLLAFWSGMALRQNFIFPLINTTYHIVASLVTLGVHIQIRTLVHTNFVSKRGITSRQRKHRYRQNARNFSQVCVFQLFRSVFCVSLNIFPLLPSQFTMSDEGNLIYLSLSTLYSFYVSCCPALSHGLTIFLTSYHQAYGGGVSQTQPRLSVHKIFTISRAKETHKLAHSSNIFDAKRSLHLFPGRISSTCTAKVSPIGDKSISPYERGVDALIVSRSDNKGCRLARSDPIYDTLFSGNGRVVRTIGTQVEDREDDHDVFTLMNSFWFMIASLLQQGTDLLPRAISTRMVAGMWWFFTLIMISSYTANLAAFLTVERMDSPIESAEDLSKQHSIKYGCLQGGSTAGFFSDSKIDTYSRMWVFMSSDKSNFVSSNALGVDRVLKENGKYAFLMESTSVEYVIERNCKLTQIGGLMDSKGYGIALPPNSPFRTPISSAILQLQEGGKLHMLKEKWWKQRKGGGKCKEVKDKEANELNLKNVGGVFLVLMMGLVLACFIACLERCWKNRKPRYDQMPGVSHSGGHLSTCTNDTSENLGCHEGLPVRFENGHINHNHLDLAGHAPNCHSSGLTGSMGHIPPNIMADTGGFLTSSLSAASLNQPSCAVPMHEHHRPSSSVTSTPGGGSGWAMMTNSNGGSRHVVSHRHHQHHHQEQCPHYNGAEYKFHEAPS
ncbi:hypothetical protein TCAL_06372 [Tigriopus californicus]|uniref:Ionotropic glutamate receptor C-terminal domain-containing protein n=1 Tax=Tigriopus californicus TaxID=6832 RepID=A0A553PF38_TIGCA|nr:hypothetical protein TCAL_06372 [Tigriopus californicus]